MKFGIGPFSMRKHPENPSSHAEIYRQAIEQVKLAEEVNFHSAWIAEHHFLEDSSSEWAKEKAHVQPFHAFLEAQLEGAAASLVQ